MAAAVEARYHPRLEVRETLGLSLDSAADPDIIHETTPGEGTLTASSTVPATKAWSDQGQLTAGTVTLDLTSLSNGSTLAATNMTGLKVQLVKITNAPATGTANTSTLTIADGASNGYTLFGDASGQVTLPVGGWVLLGGNEGLPDVASNAKNITLTSSDTDADYQILIVAG